MAQAEIRRGIQKNFVSVLGFIKRDGRIRIINASVLKHIEVFKDLVNKLEATVNDKMQELEKDARRIFDESREKARKEIVTKFKKIIANFIKEKNKLLGSLEEKITEQVISICEVVIDRELKTDRSLILGLVKKELRRITGEKLFLYLSPVDFRELKEFSESFRELEGVKVEIISDDSLEEGDCVIGNEAGVVKINLKKRLQKMKNFLKDGYHE